jgi:hypothetical protein
VDDQYRAIFHEDASRIAQHLIADATRAFRQKRFTPECPTQAVGPYTLGRATPGHEGNKVARGAINLGARAAEHHALNSIVEAASTPDQPGICEQRNVAERVIQTATQRGNDDDESRSCSSA